MGYLFNVAKIQNFHGYTTYITRKVFNNLEGVGVDSDWVLIDSCR